LATFSPDEREVKVMDNHGPQDGIVLTKEQLRRRRARSIAIALSLGALVVLFYVITIIKVGPHVLTRPM
jgi:hypothetical protein